MELLVEVPVLVLDLAKVRRDRYTRHASHDEIGSNLRLWLAHILLAAIRQEASRWS
jgi:hypothetical protein